MKYANLSDHISNSVNYGDYLQFIAVENVYKHLGIEEKDIFYISGKDIESYEGEVLLLPLNFISSIIIKDNKLAISKDIIPVFLGFSLSSVIDKFNVQQFFSIKENLDYFKKYSPIGCRDQYTYDIFLNLKIPAYLNGCLTATLPKKCISKNEKIIMVDVPKSLKSYIPQEIYENCVYMTQQNYFSNEELKDKQKAFNLIKDHYEKLSEASLVITSRLHVAVPCTAIGIPVIFTKDYIDCRFSWVEKLFSVYSIENYREINWNPKVLDFEDTKKTIIEFATKRIMSAKQYIEDGKVYGDYDKVVANKITEFYLKRNKVSYYDSHDVTHRNTQKINALDKILREKNNKLTYVLWGANKNLNFWIEYISKEYPQMVLSTVIDSYRDGDYQGYPISRPDYLEKNKVFVIVTAVSAANFAVNYMKEIGYSSSDYIIVSDEFLDNN